MIPIYLAAALFILANLLNGFYYGSVSMDRKMSSGIWYLPSEFHLSRIEKGSYLLMAVVLTALGVMLAFVGDSQELSTDFFLPVWIANVAFAGLGVLLGGRYARKTAGKRRIVVEGEYRYDLSDEFHRWTDRKARIFIIPSSAFLVTCLVRDRYWSAAFFVLVIGILLYCVIASGRKKKAC